jgi:hypothetical protein
MGWWERVGRGWCYLVWTAVTRWPGPQFAGRAFFCRWGPGEKVEDESSLGHPARNSPCHVQTKPQHPSNLSTAPSYSGPFSLQPRIPPPYRNRNVADPIPVMDLKPTFTFTDKSNKQTIIFKDSFLQQKIAQLHVYQLAKWSQSHLTFEMP